MNITAKKIILDANILVAIIGKKSPYRWIFDAIIAGNLKLCISNEILLEYREILEMKNGAEVAENVTNFLIISPFVEKIEVYYHFGLINQDSDDNKYVDCAISSSASCIVSNDKHFQVLKTIDFPKVRILSLPEFETEYQTTLP